MKLVDKIKNRFKCKIKQSLQVESNNENVKTTRITRYGENGTTFNIPRELLIDVDLSKVNFENINEMVTYLASFITQYYCYNIIKVFESDKLGLFRKKYKLQNNWYIQRIDSKGYIFNISNEDNSILLQFYSNGLTCTVDNTQVFNSNIDRLDFVISFNDNFTRNDCNNTLINVIHLLKILHVEYQKIIPILGKYNEKIKMRINKKQVTTNKKTINVLSNVVKDIK